MSEDQVVPLFRQLLDDTVKPRVVAEFLDGVKPADYVTADGGLNRAKILRAAATVLAPAQSGGTPRADRGRDEARRRYPAR